MKNVPRNDLESNPITIPSSMGTPKIYTTTGFGPRKNKEMAGVDDLMGYMQTAVKYNTFYIHHPGARSAHGVVYIRTAVFYSSLHIHHQIVHTSHFPIFLSPNPVVVYIFEVPII